MRQQNQEKQRCEQGGVDMAAEAAGVPYLGGWLRGQKANRKPERRERSVVSETIREHHARIHL